MSVTVHAAQIEMIPLADLKAYPGNARTHPKSQIDELVRIIQDSGFTSPLLVDDEGVIIAGHGRLLAAERLKMAWVPCVRVSGLTPDQIKALRLSDNKLSLLSDWDTELLKVELGELKATGFDLSLTGFPAVELAGLGIDGYALGQSEAVPKVRLADRFGIAPLSVLNAREGWWQGRKKAWLSLGIQSEVGRGDNLLKMSDTMLEPDPAKRAARGASGRPTPAGLLYGEMARPEGHPKGDLPEGGTSIFDPVLAELAYRWFCPPGGAILDPFAGGSVRGIVAAKLKRAYVGIDLRPEQVAANNAQAAAILSSADPAPTWIEGDSSVALIDPPGSNAIVGKGFDFIFSCPPYLWLEVYSEDPRDLSTMDFKGFEEVYYRIVAAAVDRLADDRFACFVVGDVRDKKGRYVDFPGMTIDAFEAAGARLYNDAILVTAVGSLAMRAGRAFETTRKLGNTHQRVLVFIKGDPRKATEAIGKVEFGEIEGAEMAATAPPAAEAPRKSRQAKVDPASPYGEKLASLGGEVL